MKLLKGKRLKSVASAETQPYLGLVYFSVGRVNIGFDRRIREEGMWHLRVCYSSLSYTPVGTEDCSAPLWPRLCLRYALRMLT